MKKLCLIAAMAVATLAANAQEKLNLSTYNGTDIAKYDGKVCDVTVNRYVFTGWNTISLPFALTQDELNETFGQNCRLERLVSAEQNGQGVTLNFQDCKAGGLQANVPYILYYTGENGNKKITKEAVVTDQQPALTVQVAGSSETVTMCGAKTHIDGVGFYGILARDNAQAQFVKVDEQLSGFYATRCYVQLSGLNNVKLTTNHLVPGVTTGINAATVDATQGDCYDLQGRQMTNGQMKKGIYVVKGQKILKK